jgi:hypothetical protein
MIDRATQRRIQILDAAERIFATVGYHEAGIADIAADLGIVIPDGWDFLKYVQGKYGTDIRAGNNIRECIDQLPDALRRFARSKAA